jgi:hypothetical protein
MTGTTGNRDAHRPLDPFIRQVLWLVDAVGGRDQLARASKNRVSARTLDNWIKGQYPKSAVTGAVRELDAWALQNVPGYPDAAGAPRLIATCGPIAAEPVHEPPPTEHAAVSDDAPRRRRWSARARVLAGGTVVVAAVAVTTVILLRGNDEASALAPLPSTGDGTLYAETTGSIGANTFADPRALIDNAQPIPADTTVQVRCRYYAPTIPSVTPDGFWYLVDSGDWAGRWSPANSFMNGDVPGARTMHNTDFAVPLCR